MAWASSASRPAYLGRGRGRGTEGSDVKTRQDRSRSRPWANTSWTSQLKEDVGKKYEHRSHVLEGKETAEEETEDRDQLDGIVSRLLQSYTVQAEGEEGAMCVWEGVGWGVWCGGVGSLLVC